jgi:hypothetical protein
MIITDGVHVVSRDLEELHRFAAEVGMKRCHFQGNRKHRHPHYDVPKFIGWRVLVANGAKLVTSKELLLYITYQN